jgi:hypothetical protein
MALTWYGHAAISMSPLPATAFSQNAFVGRGGACPPQKAVGVTAVFALGGKLGIVIESGAEEITSAGLTVIGGITFGGIVNPLPPPPVPVPAPVLAPALAPVLAPELTPVAPVLAPALTPALEPALTPVPAPALTPVPTCDPPAAAPLDCAPDVPLAGAAPELPVAEPVLPACAPVEAPELELCGPQPAVHAATANAQETASAKGDGKGFRIK